MNSKYALITGASSGIGLEIAKSLAQRNFNLVLTARSNETLKKISKEISKKFSVKVDFISSDLSEKEAPQQLYDFCKNKEYQIEILVNNAGFAIPGSFDQTPMEEEERFIRVLGIAVISTSHGVMTDKEARTNSVGGEVLCYVY